MYYANTPGGSLPQQDLYCPEKSNTIQAYLLECKLRQILIDNFPPSDYDRLHEQFGISKLELEEAIEDRVFALDRHQLQFGLDLFQEKGKIPLLLFLHQPPLISVPEPEEEQPRQLPQLLEECPMLEELGYPLEVIEEWCTEQEIPALKLNGEWFVYPNDLFSIHEPNHV